jgi:hypothetical protein
MSMKGLNTCAVRTCSSPISGSYNLCNNHRLPGIEVTVDESSMVITLWYAERTGEQGIILLNDWALGDMYGGRAGFEAELARLGFVNVRNLARSQELNAARQSIGVKMARWSGSWTEKYTSVNSNGKSIQ